MNTIDNNSLVNPSSYTGQLLKNKEEAEMRRYPNAPQTYLIATVPADWGVLDKDNALLGKVGHHAMIILPGNRICEWSPNPTPVTAVKTQVEHRKATGREIEQIWQKHLELKPRYERIGHLFDGSREGYVHYLPFGNDCFSYVNRLLKETGQKKTTLNHVIPAKKWGVASLERYAPQVRNY